MNCPFCHNPNSRVVDTRVLDDGLSIRRRRECTHCKRRFTTLETSAFQVVKRSGVIEPFSRQKVVVGVRKACQGRPVSEQDLALLAQQVEETLRATGVSAVSSEEVGKAILPYLSQLDQIAYLRFASVYRDFRTLQDFEDAIANLRASHVDDAAPTTQPRASSLNAHGQETQVVSGSDPAPEGSSQGSLEKTNGTAPNDGTPRGGATQQSPQAKRRRRTPK